MAKVSGIYIHVPFCRQGCLYCHFVTVPNREEWIDPYVRALVGELKLFSENSPKPSLLDSIYIGGGTPSLIRAGCIDTILEACANTFELAGDCEISMECNPDTLSRANAARYRRAGINRISIGAQSFHDSELHAVGRSHSAASIFTSVDMLRSIGMENINLDILLGLPFQTLDSLKTTLERVAMLDVEHISTYMLDLDEPCALAELVADGAVQSAGDDATAEMYLEAWRFLSELGYRQYEISNFARDGYACRHNMKYWRLDPVIGFGLGSHSFDGISRSANLKDMQGYLSAVQQGKLPVEWSKTLETHEILEERLFLGLRMNEGVDWKRLAGEFPAEVLNEYEKRLGRFRREGLIKWEKSRVSLTLPGMLLSNEIFQDLV